jgi:RHS repeat-associated protein
MCCLCWFTAFADADTSVVYYHNDALGSPVAATNENGDVIWKEDYAPYGAKLSDDMEAVIEKVGYTGHRYDNDTGLVYAGARMYDPSLGRFMGIDPVGAMEAVSNPVMFNRYAYGNNNPYKYVDPDGRAPHRFSDGNYSDNDGQENQGWSSQVNKAYAQMGKGIAEGWQYNPAVLIGTGGLGKGLISRFVAKGVLPNSGPIARSLGAASRSELLARKLKLNINSPTTRQVLNSLDDTVGSFISNFRSPKIRGKIPGEFLDQTVEQALRSGNSTVRKLLTDNRFVK